MSSGQELAVKIFAPPGVFRPHSDTLMLAERIRGEVRPGWRVLDLCSGSGAVAVAAARGGAAETTAIDVSLRSVAATRFNAIRNGVRVRALRGDLFAPVRGRRFDAIVSNPPYLPSADEELPRRGIRRAWEGGPDGRTILDRIIAGAGQHLRPGGVVMVVHSSLCGVEATLHGFAESGLEATVVECRTGPLGPILSSRAPLLERRGLVRGGVREEDLVVISARDRSRRSPAPVQPLARSLR